MLTEKTDRAWFSRFYDIRCPWTRLQTYNEAEVFQLDLESAPGSALTYTPSQKRYNVKFHQKSAQPLNKQCTIKSSQRVRIQFMPVTSTHIGLTRTTKFVVCLLGV